ncbi:MAG: ribonuclease III domain-containing protein [Promethearchaeota archaeon]
MDKITEDKLNRFQDLISYQFKNPKMLLQALTTPRYGNENKLPHYDILETLGDAVIKLILSLKLYNKGEDDPGNLTKIKLRLEDNRTFSKVANEMELWRYIIASNKQKIEGTSILAEVFEAICGAIYIDSGNNLKIVEQTMIDKYYYDWDSMIKDSPHLYKNQLLEYLQNIYKITPELKFEYEKLGPDNDSRWIVKNPNILDQNHNSIIELPTTLRSEEFRRIKDAEKDLSLKILKYLQEE